MAPSFNQYDGGLALQGFNVQDNDTYGSGY